MISSSRYLNFIHFLNKMFSVIYVDKKIDALLAVILLEVMSAEVASHGKDGLTPAVLARAHNLSPETARRRLISLVDDGYIEQRGGYYYLTRDSQFRQNLEEMVTEFERYGSASFID